MSDSVGILPGFIRPDGSSYWENPDHRRATMAVTIVGHRITYTPVLNEGQDPEVPFVIPAGNEVTSIMFAVSGFSADRWHGYTVHLPEPYMAGTYTQDTHLVINLNDHDLSYTDVIEEP